MQLGKKLSPLASECGQDFDKKKIHVLEDLVQMWESDKQAVVVELFVQDQPSQDREPDTDLNMIGYINDDVPDLHTITQSDETQISPIDREPIPSTFITEPVSTTSAKDPASVTVHQVSQ